GLDEVGDLVDPDAARVARVEEQQREGPLAGERRPVGLEDLDRVVVAEDLCGSLGEARVQLGGQDSRLRAYARTQPRRTDTGAGAELGHHTAARGGEGREEAPGLVAAEGDIPRAARDVECAPDDLGQLWGSAHGHSLPPRGGRS